MKIATAIEKMTDFYKGNIHDIYHFLKVWALQRTSARRKDWIQKHRKRWRWQLLSMILPARCVGKNTEIPAESIRKRKVRRSLQNFQDVPAGELDVERITWLVTHHHTYTNVEGMDYQILLEADFLVNAGESEYSKQAIENFCRKVFRNGSGNASC